MKEANTYVNIFEQLGLIITGRLAVDKERTLIE
jgi:hypothetical protein